MEIWKWRGSFLTEWNEMTFLSRFSLAQIECLPFHLFRWLCDPTTLPNDTNNNNNNTNNNIWYIWDGNCLGIFGYTLTFSIMQTKLIVDPISTCNSPEPRMNASGTTTCRFTKCDITPVDVETFMFVWRPKCQQQQQQQQNRRKQKRDEYLENVNCYFNSTHFQWARQNADLK